MMTSDIDGFTTDWVVCLIACKIKLSILPLLDKLLANTISVIVRAKKEFN